MRCEHETGPWPAGQQWPACLKCEIERLRQYEPLKGGVSVREWALQENLKLAEEGLANYAQENAQLREFISSFQELLDLDPENHPGTDLGRLMLEVTEYLRHQPLTWMPS